MKYCMSDEVALEVKIENTRPVELTELTNAFLALADEYKRHLSRSESEVCEYEPKLYVKEIKSGSIITTLTALAPHAFQFVEAYQSIMPFVDHLGAVSKYLLGQTDQKPEGTDARTYKNVEQILEPIANDSGSNLVFSPVFKDVGSVVLNFSSLEANAMQNKARAEIALETEKVSGRKEKVLLYFYQARNDTKSTTGDRAVVESLSGDPIKTIFGNEDMKKRILLMDENMFKFAYVVNLTVETIGDKPKLYTITDILDKVER